MPDTTTTRLDALRKVAETYGLQKDQNYSGAEDFAAYVDGDEPIHRYCTVTNGGEWVYVKTYEDPRAARRAATADVVDSIYPETPVAVVDLDTGATRVPDWDALPWKLER